MYTYYKPPKSGSGGSSKTQKNLCKPTKESLNVFFDNGGFVRPNRRMRATGHQGEVCKPLPYGGRVQREKISAACMETPN